MHPRYRQHASVGWGLNPEDETALRLKIEQERASLNAIPEYRKHNEDQFWLAKFLVESLFCEAREFSFPEPPQQNQVYLTSQSELKVTKPLAYVLEAGNPKVIQCESLEYTSFKQERREFRFALLRYLNAFRTNRWSKHRHKRKDAEAELGALTMSVLEQGFQRAGAAYDVGSSLYLYQQMHDRKIITSPALSRATWLVKNAPLRKPIPEKPIPRGKWQRIQEQWRNYFSDSHYWAAVVATTRSPLSFKEELLFDFVCDVDVELFKKIANSFMDFRIRVVPPKTSNIPMYLKQGLTLFEIEENNLAEIPNALEDFQWEALLRYPAASK